MTWFVGALHSVNQLEVVTTEYNMVNLPDEVNCQASSEWNWKLEYQLWAETTTDSTRMMNDVPYALADKGDWSTAGQTACMHLVRWQP